MADAIRFKILKDGTIQSTIAGQISEANHSTAENLFADMARLTGGPVTRTALEGGEHHHHQHEHGHEHQHG